MRAAKLLIKNPHQQEPTTRSIGQDTAMGNPTAALLYSIYFLTLGATPVLSWGPQFEPLRKGHQRFSILEAKKNNDHDEDLVNFRQLLERSFSTFDGDSDDPISAFVREEGELDNDDVSVKRALDRMYVSDSSSAEAVDSPCDGEYCDIDGECAIPESFKIVPGKDAVDVMAFLGIRRAEPIRVGEGNSGEWQ